MMLKKDGVIVSKYKIRKLVNGYICLKIRIQNEIRSCDIDCWRKQLIKPKIQRPTFSTSREIERK